MGLSWGIEVVGEGVKVVVEGWRVEVGVADGRVAVDVDGRVAGVVVAG
jgi:sRNA-binding protein